MSTTAALQLLQYFEYSHLPPKLEVVSKPFHDLAHDLYGMDGLTYSELIVSLRKLLEAKDAAVRAALN